MFHTSFHSLHQSGAILIHALKIYVFVNGNLTTVITIAAKFLNASELGLARSAENVRLSLKARPRDPSLEEGGSVDSVVTAFVAVV